MTETKEMLAAQGGLSPERISLISITARAMHGVLRGYCRLEGDFTMPEWNEAPKRMQELSFEMTQTLFNAFDRGEEPDPKAMHDLWWEDMQARGWTCGPVEDEAARTHPDMLPYECLPHSSRVKDFLALAVAKAFYDQQDTGETQ